jgi:hypothetical protein
MGRVFSITDTKPVFSGIGSIDQVVASTASHSMLTSLHSLGGFTSYEVVFSVLSKEYSYVSVWVSVAYSVFFYFFLFLVFFTAFAPLPQQLQAGEVFLLSLDSAYGFVESEKEVGSMDDILLPVILTLTASVAWFYLLLPFQVLGSFDSFLHGFFLLLFCCIIVSLPVNLLYECGFFFSTFFRGSAGSTSTLMELVYDLIANTTMFARMQVQHVRVVLGLAMYVETSNFVESLSINQLLSPASNSSLLQYTTNLEHYAPTGVSFVSDVFMQIGVLIAEFGHYIVFLLQSSASYAALIF